MPTATKLTQLLHSRRNRLHIGRQYQDLRLITQYSVPHANVPPWSPVKPLVLQSEISVIIQKAKILHLVAGGWRDMRKHVLVVF